MEPVKASVVSLMRVAARTLAGVSTLAGTNKIHAAFFRDGNQNLNFYDQCVHAQKNCRINICFSHSICIHTEDLCPILIFHSGQCELMHSKMFLQQKKMIPRGISPTDFR